MMENDFCVFVLSHGRADNVRTVESLRKHGYTGEVVIVIDDGDSQRDKYYDNFPRVEMFNKAETVKTFDVGDNFSSDIGAVYARNACFDIARRLNYTYFIVLDDDYQMFEYRVYDTEFHKPRRIHNLDKVFDLLLEFYKSTNAASIAMAQGGDFIGGMNNQMAKHPTLFRKCMNSFICSTEREFHFHGRMNEDVSAYTHEASKGLLMFTVPFCSLVQAQTQASSGGMTGIYIDQGTYVKSFYSVMFQPSSVSVKTMGDTHRRLHHSVMWNNTVPKIVSESKKIK
jgi:hypothetical protein